MKTYKHKQTGLIVIQGPGGTNYALVTKPNQGIPAELIENTNDWEEVIEKEFEIVSFRQGNTGYLWVNKSDKNLWSRKDGITAPYNTQEILNNNLYVIYSVKRLSDGEVFTIGDKTNGGTIKEIMHCTCNVGKSPFIHIVYNHDLEGSNYPDFINVKKLKQSLFKTEDGVDIFEGDMVYYTSRICNHNSSYDNIRDTQWTTQCINHPNNIHFSTKEKAEEYILWNKPVLSLNDVENLIDKDELFIEDIEELVKKRFNE